MRERQMRGCECGAAQASVPHRKIGGGFTLRMVREGDIDISLTSPISLSPADALRHSCSYPTQKLKLLRLAACSPRLQGSGQITRGECSTTTTPGALATVAIAPMPQRHNKTRKAAPFCYVCRGESGGSHKAKAAKVMGFFTATVLDYFHLWWVSKKKQLALALWFAEVRWGSAAYAEVAV